MSKSIEYFLLCSSCLSDKLLSCEDWLKLKAERDSWGKSKCYAGEHYNPLYTFKNAPLAWKPFPIKSTVKMETSTIGMSLITTILILLWLEIVNNSKLMHIIREKCFGCSYKFHLNDGDVECKILCTRLYRFSCV